MRASARGSARVAVVGAASAVGLLVRDALAEAGVPGDRVELYGVSDGEAVISEYAGEARLVQDPDLVGIALCDVIFLCEPGDLARQTAAVARREALVVDVGGCLGGATGAAVLHPAINLDAATASGGTVAVPHPLAIVLSELLLDIERGPGVLQALALVICPAADHGEAGIEELRDQTVRLLSFAELPTRVFGRQLAFNLLPGDDRGAGRIASDVQAVLAWDRPRLAVSLVTAPVFHGHLLQVHVRTRAATAAAPLRLALEATPFASVVGRVDDATPLDVPGEPRTLVVGPREDGLGGFWIWAVAGAAGAHGAAVAVALAARLADV